MLKPESRRIGALVGLMMTVVGFWGCDASKIEQLQKEVDQIDGALKEARQENRKLRDELERLRAAIDELTIKNEMLGARLEELDDWSQRMVEGYGTGVWYTAEFARPVFVERLPGASVDRIVRALNQRFQKDGLPTLLPASVSGDKVTLSIENEEMLTNRMGSSGAASYLNAVFYSLTSVQGIRCVRFRFEGGDHAVPGEYCK